MNINGKEVALRFGMLCIEEFSKRVYEKQKNPTGTYGIASMIYAAAVNYYEVKEETLPVTFEEVYDYVENNWHETERMKEFVKVSEDFVASQAFQKQSAKQVEKKS